MRHSEVHIGSKSFGRNRLKVEMNTKYFVFRLIWYGFVRPGYAGKLVNFLK